MNFLKKICYRASAGSGKTFELTARYISLLLLGISSDKILAITFTNKAASEIQNRVLDIVLKLHLKEKDSELQKLSEILSLSNKEILQKRDTILDSLLTSNINISTIDSFFSSISRNFSSHMNINPDFNVTPSVDKYDLKVKFIDRCKRDNLYNNLIKFLIEENKSLSYLMNLLEIFFAQSIAITTNIEEIYEKKAPSLSKTIQTTNLDIEIKKKAYKTILSIRDRYALSNRAKRLLDIKSYEEIDNFLKKSFLKLNTLRDHTYFKKYYTEDSDISFAKLKKELSIYIQVREIRFLENLLKFYTSYKNIHLDKQKNLSTLTFNSLTNSVYKLMYENNIENSFLYFRLDYKIEHLLIDEFQDTSVVQYEILKPIIEEICSGIGVKTFRSFFYVGDTKQSIYRFRRGEQKLFNIVKNRFEIKEKSLDKNYRTRRNIVNFTNEIFKNKFENYIPQKSFKSDGYVKVATSDDIKLSLLENIKELLRSGVCQNEIAILTLKNEDAFALEYLINSNISGVKAIAQIERLPREVDGIIYFIRYIYFKKKIYLFSFLSLIGKDFEKNIDIDYGAFNTNIKLQKLIINVVNKFNLYTITAKEKILRLIEISYNYEDIEEFLFDYENIKKYIGDANLIDAIKILTIHKSKGLEFEHVIICDTLSKKDIKRKEPILFEYDENFKVVNIYKNFIKAVDDNRKTLDRKYYEASKVETSMIANDNLNIFYVAFTRAKNSLIVCKMPKEKTYFKDLIPDNYSTFQTGKIVPSSSNNKKQYLDKIIKVDYKDIKYGAQSRQKKKSLKREIYYNNFYLRTFGVALHSILENINSFKKMYVESSYQIMYNMFGHILTKKDCLDIKNRVKMLIENRHFLSLLNDGKISKEQLISTKELLVRVDLMIEKSDSVIVIDYKSSTKGQEEHIKQVKHYKSILRGLMGKSVYSYICYLTKKEISFISI